MTALKKGFTLIELLIVMAILGVLAVVVLVAINPAEQMRRARDAGKISGAQQIGRAVVAYYTANGLLPAEATWAADLVASQELSVIPTGITTDGDTVCTNGDLVENTWCYSAEGNGGGANQDTFTVSAELFSQQRIAQCASGVPFSIFSSESLRLGISL